MSDQRFLADHMLIKLAKWLRMTGHDVSSPPQNANDSDLISMACKEERVLITRDKDLAQRCKKLGVGCIFVKSSHLEDQLREMKGNGLFLQMRPIRCTMCNGKLMKVTDERHKKRYPFLNEDTATWICQRCGRVYWEGSHWKKIKEKLSEIDEEES